MINVGKLNKKITFNKPAQISDGGGGRTDALIPVITVWGNVTTAPGRDSVKEVYFAQQAQVEVTHKIIVRYNSLITREQVITHGNKTYNIETVTSKDEKNIYMEILAVERL